MLLLRFIYWKIRDLITKIKTRKDSKIHLYGIYGYFGLPGQGKTMSMSWELMNLRKKYGDKIYIFIFKTIICEDIYFITIFFP